MMCRLFKRELCKGWNYSLGTVTWFHCLYTLYSLFVKTESVSSKTRVWQDAVARESLMYLWDDRQGALRIACATDWRDWDASDVCCRIFIFFATSLPKLQKRRSVDFSCKKSSQCLAVQTRASCTKYEDEEESSSSLKISSKAQSAQHLEML